MEWEYKGFTMQVDFFKGKANETNRQNVFNQINDYIDRENPKVGGAIATHSIDLKENNIQFLLAGNTDVFNKNLR